MNKAIAIATAGMAAKSGCKDDPNKLSERIIAVHVRYAPIIITSPWAKLANLRMLNVRVMPIAPRA